MSLIFDPTLQPTFAKRVKSPEFAINDSRDLFYSLIHSGEGHAALAPAYFYLKSHFQHVNEHCTEWLSDRYSPESLTQLLRQTAQVQQTESGSPVLSDFLVQYAPLFFTELAWLPSISQTVSCQSPLAIDLMAVYLRLVKSGQGIAKSRLAYFGYLLATGVEIPALHTFAFAKQANMDEEIFDFAAVQLALAHFPRVFFPEVLGFTLAFCHCQSLLEHFFPVAENSTLPDFIKVRIQRRRLEVPAIKAVIQSYLADFPEQCDVLWQRIQMGFWLNVLHNDYCQQCTATQLQTVLSPRQAMHKLLQGLIPNAIGHHGNIRLGGKTIDEWFQEKPFKSENFLASLLLSPLVDRAKPENSKLLKLYEFGGPMFGVLDDEGKAVLKTWLMSELNASQVARRKPTLAKLKSRSYAYGLKKINQEPIRIKSEFVVPAKQSPVNSMAHGRLTSNELYYYLVNADLFPVVLPKAKRVVDGVLFKAKLFSHVPFRHYSHPAFERYINALYQREVKRYQPINGKPKLSKASYAWGVEQFAPTILTDGSWLQNVQHLALLPTHPIGDLLGKIYHDEIGNGNQAQNHPQIYQALLDSLAIKLPPIQTKEFANHPGFIKGAFDIPVYLMAIAKFPSTYLAGIVGLEHGHRTERLGQPIFALVRSLALLGHRLGDCRYPYLHRQSVVRAFGLGDPSHPTLP